MGSVAEDRLPVRYGDTILSALPGWCGVESMKLAHLKGKLVLVEFMDHAKGQETPMPCMVVGWLTLATQDRLVLTPWRTDGKPDMDEVFALVRRATTKVTALSEDWIR